MCCESERPHGAKYRRHHHHGHHRGHRHGDSCCCDEHSRFGPAFWTKAEKIAKLDRYLECLQEEAKAIEERIAALKAEE